MSTPNKEVSVVDKIIKDLHDNLVKKVCLVKEEKKQQRLQVIASYCNIASYWLIQRFSIDRENKIFYTESNYRYALLQSKQKIKNLLNPTTIHMLSQILTIPQATIRHITRLSVSKCQVIQAPQEDTIFKIDLSTGELNAL